MLGTWGVLRVDHYSYYYFQEWIDNNLRWNESEYGNVKDLRFPPSTIWTPDILMYNRYQLDRSSWSFGFIEANLGMQPLLADWANIVLTQISIYLRVPGPRQPRIYFARWIYCCLPPISSVAGSFSNFLWQLSNCNYKSITAALEASV